MRAREPDRDGFAERDGVKLAYEVFGQLGGRVPAAVFIPTSNAQLLFGVWKGFRELRDIPTVASVNGGCSGCPGSPLTR